MSDLHDARWELAGLIAELEADLDALNEQAEADKPITDWARRMAERAGRVAQLAARIDTLAEVEPVHPR